MKDVSTHIHQTTSQSVHSEKNASAGNTVHQFPKVDKWKVPNTYKIWELSEKALKKHDIID